MLILRQPNGAGFTIKVTLISSKYHFSLLNGGVSEMHCCLQVQGRQERQRVQGQQVQGQQVRLRRNWRTWVCFTV
jgi:hypothetical protein